MDDNGYRMFLQDGKIFPVIDVDHLDDQDIMDRLEEVVERFDGVYIYVNVGRTLPTRMRALSSNNKRSQFLCPEADVEPLKEFLNLVVGSSIFADQLQGYVFSNIIPPLFRFENEKDVYGNIISVACACDRCEKDINLLTRSIGANSMVLTENGEYGDKIDFAQRIWLWATAFDRANIHLGEFLQRRLESYDRVMKELSSISEETYLLYPEAEYSDLAFHVNGLDDIARRSYGIDDRWLDHFTGIIASPLFELDWDEEHLMSWNIDDSGKLLRLKYLEPDRRVFIDSKLSPEVMSRVLQG